MNAHLAQGRAPGAIIKRRELEGRGGVGRCEAERLILPTHSGPVITGAVKGEVLGMSGRRDLKGMDVGRGVSWITGQFKKYVVLHAGRRRDGL